MVARLEIKLAAKEPLSNQMASVFQGVLMELLPEKICGIFTRVFVASILSAPGNER